MARSPPAAAGGLPASAMALAAALARERAGQFAALWTLIVVAAAFGVGAQYGMKLIVDAMAASERGRDIWAWLALYIGLIAGESVLWRLSGWLGANAVVSVGVDVRLRLFDHLCGHSVDYVTRNSSGALGSRVTATAGAAGALVATFTWKIAPPCVDFIGAAIVLLTIDPWMAAVLSVFVVLVAIIIVAFGRRGRPLHHAYAAENSRVTGALIDVVSNLWTVKAFAAREREYRRAAAMIRHEGAAQRRSWHYLEKARMLHDLCLWVMAGTMMTWVIHQWTQGRGTPGDVVVVSALSFRILHGSRELALALVEASQHLGVIGEMLGVVAVQQEPADPPDAHRFIPGSGSIRFRDVDFAYPGGAQVLSRFELDILAGQRVGIVGPSGSGKTTVLALIQRLHDVHAGAVCIDGQDVRDVGQDSLRQAIAVVPQEISLLHRTIGDNLRFGRPEASDDAVRAVSAAAECEEFIGRLPRGYDTLVGERGARLSGGQRQRVGIARAMLKDASILLLDEATSALDSASESQIQSGLARLMRGRTVVAVAHRLSTVAGFDRVIVMDGGRIVEDGPHDALLAAGGMYRRLWTAQAAGQETA